MPARPAGCGTCFFGVPLAHWDAQTRQALAALGDVVDTGLAAGVWEAALAAAWLGPPTWFHGDVSPGNLLAEHGRLSAVIDFGIAGVGDPACDTAIAWTFFSGESRRTFKALLPVDDATWARGRGWALWKAAITLVRVRDYDPDAAADSTRVVSAVIADQQGRGRRHRGPAQRLHRRAGPGTA